VFLTILAIGVPDDAFNKIVADIKGESQRDLALLAVKEGVTTTVSVHIDLNPGTLQLYSSGQALAGEDLGTRCDQKMLGHLGILLNSNAKRALTVGFGSGETTRCLSLHELSRVDCAEIAPEVVDISLEFFRHINLGEQLNEKINMIYMDAKNYLHLTGSKYDVIINDSIHPRAFAENASLYGKEFYESAKERLNDDGMILIWVPYDRMPISALSSIVGTLLDVFPHVTLWCSTYFDINYFWLVASKQQQFYSPKHIEDEMHNDSIRESLSEIKIRNSIDVLNYYIGDERDLRKHLTDYSLNSDYYPFVEFDTDPETLQKEMYRRFVMDVRNNSIYDHIDWTGFNEEEKETWITEYKQLYKAHTYVFTARGIADELKRLNYIVAGLKGFPDNPGLLRAKNNMEKSLFSYCLKYLVSGEALRADAIANGMLGIYPESANAWIIKSGVSQIEGNLQKTLFAARKAVELAPDSADAHYRLADVFAKSGQPEKAVIEFEKVLQIEPDKYNTLDILAYLMVVDEKAGYYNPTRAIQLAERACKLTRYKGVKYLNTLAMAYAAAGRFSDAIEATKQGIEITSFGGQTEMTTTLKQRLQRYKAAQK
ncbi:MAG: fused MFS/spermidine synthase, partial [Planctomycetota bacterium]